MKRILLSMDPEQNRYRFFSLELQVRDDGRAELRRRWGRIGTEGRTHVDVFDNTHAAQAAHDVLLTRRQRRGYHIADAAGHRLALRLLAGHRAGRRNPAQKAFPSALGF